ncbi:MAG: AAA family ATPase, partial [Candidatus Methylumidiphilus sp.]
MFSPIPSILLAFANAHGGGQPYLRQLGEERRRLERVWRQAERAGLCRVELLPDATARDIVRAFLDAERPGAMAGLHFAGHADGFSLLLETEDGGTAEAAGGPLADFLGRQAGLAWVFLNGCETAGHVGRLLDAGVPAVIASARRLDDFSACDFAEALHIGLARNGQTLAEACATAAAAVSLLYAGGVERGVRFASGTSTALAAGLWRLHSRDAAAGLWRLRPADPLAGLPLPADIGWPAAPYLNLQSFSRAHARIFFGRGADIRALCGLLADPAAPPIVLLCGQSGVGKSSLLAAGLLPRLEAGHAVVALRHTPVAALDALLAEIGAAAGQGLAQAWRDVEARTGKPLLVLLDQVEALLPENGAPPGGLAALLAALAEVFDAPPRGRLLLAFRKEWLAEVEHALERHGLGNFGKRVLGRLDAEGVAEAVAGVCRDAAARDKYGAFLPPGEAGESLAQTIAADVLQDPSAPAAPIVQILLSRLWQEARRRNADAPRIDAALYQAVRREGLLLDDFFQRRLAAWEAAEPVWAQSGLALDVLRQHTSPLGAAAECPPDALRQRYPHCTEGLDAVLDFFRGCFVLADGAGKSTRLAHDLLAPLVRREYEQSVRPGQRARRILEERIRHGAALPLDDLATVERGRDGMRAWTAAETRLVADALAQRRRTRRRRRLSRAALAGLALAVVLAAAALAGQWWEGLRRQSELLAALSRQQSELGNTARGLALALDALPQPGQPRPYVLAAETALAYALSLPLEYQRLPQGAAVFALAFAADGRVATAAADGAVRLWDAQGVALAELQTPGAAAVYDLAFSADGRRLAAAGADGARVWDLQNGAALWRLAPSKEMLRVSTAPAGDALLTLTGDGVAQWWPLSAFAPGTVAATAVRLPCGGAAVQAVFSPDAAQAVVACADRVLLAVDSASGAVRWQIETGEDLGGLAFSPDGARLAVAVEGAVEWRSPQDGRLLRRWAVDGMARRLAFSADGAQLAALDGGGRLLRWTLAEGEAAAALAGAEGLADFAYSPDGLWLAGVARDAALRLWDLDSGQLRLQARLEAAPRRVVFAADGRSVAVAGDGTFVRRWRLGPLAALSKATTAAPPPTDDSAGGPWRLTHSARRVQLSAADGRPGLSLDYPGQVRDAALSPDGAWLAVAAAGQAANASEYSVCLYATADGRQRWCWTQPQALSDLSFSPDGRLLLVAALAGLDNASGEVWVFQAADGGLRFRLPHALGVSRVGFDAAGQGIVTVAEDGAVRVYTPGVCSSASATPCASHNRTAPSAAAVATRPSAANAN